MLRLTGKTIKNILAMLTDRTNKALYWILATIGVVISFTAMFLHFSYPDNDWCQVGMTSGVAIALLGLVFEPITQKKLENRTAGNVFFLVVFFAIVAVFWIIEIHDYNLTLPMAIVSALVIILLIIDCWLAYKKRQRIQVLEKELEQSESEKNEG